MADTAKNARDLFLDALARGPAERAGFLDAACAGDAPLRRRVEALLQANDEPGAFLSEPGAGATGTFASGAPEGAAPRARETEAEGSVVGGRYKLLQQIGEGGMGSVWMAEQREPVRRLVAVKLIKAGMDSRTVLARFEAERQALALMDHPNIARVLDGGTTGQGRPFFVMELVKGLPLTEYCDQRQMGVRGRLALFVHVCKAVQHAHQKGVIHRDIKPSNVLVTEHDGSPVPKVIDFGLAKALHTPALLTERTLHTAFGSAVGTPLYMAPEQVAINALDVDTRADVYALGVVLYELLTGTTPLDRASLQRAVWDEVRRLIQEDEPPRPSVRLSSAGDLAALAASRGTEPGRLAGLVRGELDWVVMKALEKDRSRRYETAAGFAADVERYLADEVVEARPPSTWYRLRKFASRNRTPLAVAGLLIAALVAGVAGTSIGLAQAVGERRKADAARNAAEENEKKAVRAGEQLQAARDELWAQLYASRAGQIQAAWNADDYGRARELLAAQIPAAGQRDLRGFEWHYFDRQLNADLRTVTLPRARPYMAPISPDGSRLLRFIEEGESLFLKSFDTSTGRVALSIPLPPKSAIRPAYSPDSKWIVATIHDQSGPVMNIGTADVRRWDAASGAEAPRVRGVTTLSGVMAGPDALPAVWAQRTKDDKGPVYRIWDGATVKVINLPEGRWGNELAISADGAVLAMAVEKDGKGAVELVEARTGRPLAGPGDPIIPLTGLFWTSPPAGCIAFSRDGKRLAVAAETLTLWEVKPRRKLAEVKVRAASPVFSPDGGQVAYILGAEAGIADVATGQVRRFIRGHDGGITNLAFTRDGAVLVTAGGGSVKHWDALIDERVWGLRDHRTLCPNWSRASPDGTLLLRHNDDGLGFTIVDRADKAVITHAYPGWKAAPHEPVMGIAGPPGMQEGMSLPLEAVFSRDNRRLALWVWQGYRGQGTEVFKSRLQLWKLGPWTNLTNVELPGKIAIPTFSADGRSLAALTEPGGRITVWDTETGKERFRLPLPRGKDFVIRFSSDGARLAVLGSDGESLAVGLWEAERGRPLPSASIPFGREWGRRDTRWTPPLLGPGGKRLAVPLQTDVGPGLRMTIIRVWDAEDGARPVELRGFKQGAFIGQMAFSPDGGRLATVSRELLQVWNPDTGDELLRVPLVGDHVPPGCDCIEHLSFTPDGRAITFVAWNPRVWFQAGRLGTTPRSP